MTSVMCSKRDCKHYNHGYCQLDEILIMGGFYKDIPYCSDYERDIPYCYRVNVIVSNYPSGKIVEEKEVDFDDYDKALKYADENIWVNPMQTSKAVILKRQMSWVAMRDGEAEIPEK